MIGPNKLYDIIITNSYYLSKINSIVLIKFIKKPLMFLIETIVKYKLIGLFEGYSIEKILYEFAVLSYSFNLTSGKLNKIRKDTEDTKYDPILYGIDYKVLSDNKENVTGICMIIWSEDRMARLNLELISKYGIMKLNVNWKYLNKYGVFENYNRTDSILNSREEIKEILVEYISKYCLYFLYYCEKISPSR